MRFLTRCRISILSSPRGANCWHVGTFWWSQSAWLKSNGPAWIPLSAFRPRVGWPTSVRSTISWVASEARRASLHSPAVISLTIAQCISCTLHRENASAILQRMPDMKHTQRPPRTPRCRLGRCEDRRRLSSVCHCCALASRFFAYCLGSRFGLFGGREGIPRMPRCPSDGSIKRREPRRGCAGPSAPTRCRQRERSPACWRNIFTSKPRAQTSAPSRADVVTNVAVPIHVGGTNATPDPLLIREALDTSRGPWTMPGSYNFQSGALDAAVRCLGVLLPEEVSRGFVSHFVDLGRVRTSSSFRQEPLLVSLWMTVLQSFRVRVRTQWKSATVCLRRGVLKYGKERIAGST